MAKAADTLFIAGQFILAGEEIPAELVPLITNPGAIEGDIPAPAKARKPRTKKEPVEEA